MPISKKKENTLKFQREIKKLFNEKKFGEIIRLLENGQKDYKNKQLLMLLALAYDQKALSLKEVRKRKENQDKALRLYKKLLKQYPNNKEVLLGLARVYLHQKKYNQSLRFYKKILMKWKNDESAFVGLGNLYFAQGSYKKAERYYQKALGLNNKSIINWSNLAFVYKFQGNNKKALKYFKKAISILENKKTREKSRVLDKFLSQLKSEKEKLEMRT